jgi:DNA-binding transcriptional ArsR family regulator
MEKEFLENCLAKGMSLETIGEQTGKHPSTVSYWLKKCGLTANGSSRHSPKGSVDRARLSELVSQGASIREIAKEFDVGYSTIRYWLERLGLETDRMTRVRETKEARELGLRRTYLRCLKHGHTAFFARPDGGFRCAKCSTSAVSERRRTVKRQLVEEAGGRCLLCGFDDHPAALQFHHLDPSQKEFHLSHRGFTRCIEKARAEAAKCVLLCANCHALVEVGARELSLELSPAIGG